MTYIQARPTVHNGVQMRSRLEAAYAAHMDERGEAWTYEPRCYSSTEGQYLPDFEVGPGWYREVKPTEEEAVAGLARMHVILASEPEAILHAVYPKGWEDGRYTGWIAHGCSPRFPCGSCGRDLPDAPLWMALEGDGSRWGWPWTPMCCPFCESIYMHVDSATCGEGAPFGNDPRPQARIGMWCEGCGARYDLLIGNHKGQSFASFHRTA